MPSTVPDDSYRVGRMPNDPYPPGNPERSASSAPQLPGDSAGADAVQGESAMPASAASTADARESGACSCDAAKIPFPQSFPLRIIYGIDGEENLRRRLPALFAAYAVAVAETGYTQVGSGKFGRASVSATFTSLDQMRAVYAAIGAIDGVKAVV